MGKTNMTEENQQSKLQELSKRLFAIYEGFYKLRDYIHGLKTVFADDKESLVCLRNRIIQLLVKVYQANIIYVDTLCPDLLYELYPEDIMFRRPLDGIQYILQDLLHLTFWPETKELWQIWNGDSEDDSNETVQTAIPETLYDRIADLISKDKSYCEWGGVS